MLLAALATISQLRGRQATAQSHCASNLERMGLAIGMYADDNRGRLPGPVFTLANASYDMASSNQLVWFLAESLGNPKPSVKRASAKVFVCPSGLAYPAQLGSGPESASYALNSNVRLKSGTRLSPFGDPARPDALPLTLSNLTNYGPASRLITMTDADKGNVNPTLPDWRSLAPKPRHGKFRNQLYFDGHVTPTRW